MKKIQYKSRSIAVVLGYCMTVLTSCDRSLSEDVEFATFSNTAEIFTDNFIGLGSNFYFPFVPDGAKPDVFSVDDDVAYLGTASIRIDVPNADDPSGGFAGANFVIDGSGRNLTEYDALTFWAKSSQAATIGDIGFGEEYRAAIANVDFTTNWKKYIIPIPDPSKLTEERTVFGFSAGGIGNVPGQEVGYTFWIDELQFENLGTIAQPGPAILKGKDETIQTFVGSNIPLTGLTQTYNLEDGSNQTVSAAPAYFTFKSSDPDIARVNELGIVSILNQGTAVITATLGNVKATGSLTFEVSDSFELAPTPTKDPSDVISIFSDYYTNVPVDFYNGYWQPWQTTESEDFAIDGDNILNYTNFNFVGTQFANPTIDATELPNLHINMYIPSDVPSNLDFLISLVDFGADGVDGGNDDSRQQVFFNSSDFVADKWSTLEIPITLTNRNQMGLIIYENVNGSSLTNFYLDNIYFYK